jgi:hypothetical protein
MSMGLDDICNALNPRDGSPAGGEKPTSFSAKLFAL